MFSGIVTGHEGAQFVNHESQQYDLGTIMFIDDRSYHYVEMGAADSVAGNLYQSQVASGNEDNCAVVAAVAVGSREVTLTTGEITVASDYIDGYLNIEDVDGEGRAYKIKDNAGAASGATDTITLKAAGGINAALTTSTKVSLFKHPCMDVIRVPGPATAAPIGVAVNVISANQFGWMQIRGPASVLTEGTSLVIGQEVTAGTSGLPGAVLVSAGNATPTLGVCIFEAPNTSYSLIALDIPGFGI